MTLTWAAPGLAFVCTQAADDSGVNSGPALSWRSRKIVYTLQAAGTTQLDRTATFATLQNAFLVWQNLSLADDQVPICGNLPGTDLTFVRSPLLGQQAWVGYDYLDPNNNTNLLVFRDGGWTYTANAVDTIALTTSTYSQLTGEIIDADIEFNSWANQFSITDPPGASDYDLLNTAVHEVGHFVGLAHCGATTCGNHEVMEPTANPAETIKRLLKCDDRAAIVFKYPAQASNQYCATTPNAACGFCAPPITPSAVPLITIVNRITGRGGASCQQAGAGPMAALWPMSWWILTRLARRRRASRTRVAILPERRRWQTGAALMAIACGTCHCGSSECDGTAYVPSANAPMIVGMDLTQQIQNDPWRLVLATDFVDYSGDLGTGMVHFYSNHNTAPTLSQSLATIFESSGGLDPNSVQGRVALLLRFPQTTVSNSQLHLGTQLVDAAQNRSNCYVMDLRFLLTNAQ